MRPALPLTKRVARRRGAVAPAVAVMLVVLLGFVALAVDSGYIFVSRAEMQHAIDSAALAGAAKLPGPDPAVIERARVFAGHNIVASASVAPRELDVFIGNWDGRGRRFVPRVPGDPAEPNAVFAIGTRLGLGLWFAPALGITSASVRKAAVAVAGAGRCAGVWGLDGITADGNIVTDSYDSNLGPYGPGNIRRNGDVCSCRDIVANGGISIYGDAMYGEGYAFIPEGTSYTVWGIIDDHACGPPPIEPDFAGAAANNDNATIGLTARRRTPFPGGPWHLYVTGSDSLTLNGGTYYFHSVMLDGQATLRITGPTEIYVAGPGVFTGGGVVNVSRDPKDLVIYSSGPTLNLSGTAGFYGGVVAPNTDVLLEGTGDYYGTILARTLDIDGDAVIHVDESLVFELYGLRSVAPILVK